MGTGNFYLNDMDIKSSDIPSNRSVETSEDAIELAKEVNPGEYISILNRNDLSRVLIYRRTDYQPDNLSIYKWDGKTVDTSWFTRKNEGIYYIHNADQLAGLGLIIEDGYNFKDQVIKLTSDIKLNHKPWNPIGSYYSIEYDEDDSEYFVVNIPNKEKVFSGTFDGNDHVIYGLTISDDRDKSQEYGGLFYSLMDATVKNLVLADVSIESGKSFSNSALFGYARRCEFVNICIDGEIHGPKCAPIGGVAIDCSFTECLNRSNIHGYSSEVNDDINIGGLVQYIGLSQNTVDQLHTKEPKIFIRCLQLGSIDIDAKGARSLYCGQLFGSTLYKKKGEPYGIQIDRCIPYDGGIPEIKNLDNSITRTNFYGKVNGSDSPKNCISGIDTKIDLLSGLLGKTNINISVNVIHVTASTKIDALIIPGSVNTLKSDEYMNSFITEDVSKITDSDCISNLYPYYKFVKQSKI